MGAWLQEGIVPIDAGARSPRPARRLSIEATFTLIAAINGIVLAYLLATAVRVLRVSGGGERQVVVSLALTVLLAVLAVLSYLILKRRIVGPIRRLLRESRQIRTEDPSSFFSTPGEDEISRLALGFNQVLRGMRQALADRDASNRDLLAARHQIDSSLRYANILQRSILPDRQLQESLGTEQAVLWLPRDSVGGDCYLVHRQAGQDLVGVADCAGHGVSGAMMTMLAQAALDRAIFERGLASPGALLESTDQALRLLLGEADSSRDVATSVDLALVVIDRPQRQLRFAGARIGLYWSDGRSIGHQPGGGRSLGDSRPGSFTDHTIPLEPCTTYTLSTDGLLDQGGGPEGFCLGRERFTQWLLELAPLPPAEQIRQVQQRLEQFRGPHPQRDDITLLAFRMPPEAGAP